MKGAEDGDLFPRNSASDSTPRIKRPNGEVLFHPNAKRARLSRGDDDVKFTEKKASVTMYGSSLTLKRLQEGMITLALITRTSEDEVFVTLPSGIRARAIDDTLIEDEQLSRMRMPAFQNSRSHMEDEVSEDDDDDDDEDDDESSDGDDDDDNKEDREQDDDDDDDDSADEDEDDDDDDGEVKPLWKVVRAGQILPAAVVSVGSFDSKHDVKVSLKPHLVNIGLNPAYLFKKNFPVYAAVLSVEDHGYVLSFGSNISHSGFLPFYNCDFDGGRRSPMSVGTPVRVVTETDITAAKTKRNSSLPIRVCARRERVNRATVETLESAAIQDLTAGTLVRARVVQEGPGGLLLMAFGLFQINVDACHVPSNENGRLVQVDKNVTARILYCDAASKFIGASLLDCFVNDLAPPAMPTSWKIGTLLKPLTVELIRPKFGLSLRYDPKLGDDGDGDDDDDDNDNDDEEDDMMATDDYDEDPEMLKMVSVFASMSRASDSKLQNLEMKFHNSMRIPKGGRVISLSKLDGVVNVDLRESLLIRKALSMDEIEAGSIFDCKVAGFEAGRFSVSVEGDPNLPGVILRKHVSDVALSEKKLLAHKSFRAGATVKCVALSISSKFGPRRVLLSARKSLVSPRYPLLTSLEDVEARLQNADGQMNAQKLIYSGTVEKVCDNLGLVVSFCNNIRGFVPVAQLALDTGAESSMRRSSKIVMADVLALYPLNQTVYVRVVAVNSVKRKLTLSMNLDSAQNNFKPGDFVDGRIVSIDDELEHFVVSIKAKRRCNDADDNENEQQVNIDCVLPFQHLGDLTSVTDYLTKGYKRILKEQKDGNGSRGESGIGIDSAMVLAIQDDGIMLTMKQSLKQAFESGSLPNCFDDITKLEKKSSKASGNSGRLLSGYVKNILPRGATIGFLGNLVGFLPLVKITDHYVSDAAHVLTVHQSVTTIISNIQPESNRFYLSTRRSDVGNLTDDLTLNTFGQFNTWRDMLGRPNVDELFPIGSLAKATVTDVHKNGIQYAMNTPKGDFIGIYCNVEDATLVNFKRTFKMLTGEKNRGSDKTSKRTRPTVNQVKDVRVLDVDPLTGYVDITHEDEFISCGDLNSKIEPGRNYPAKVIIAKKTHVTLLILNKKPALAFALANDEFNAQTLQIGSNQKVRCLDTRDIDSNRNLVVIEGAWDNPLKVEKSGSYQSQRAEVIQKIKNAALTDDLSAIVGLKLDGKVFKHFPRNASVRIGMGVVGHLHICNTGSVTQEELDKIDLGPLPAELSARFKVPETGSRLPSMIVTGIHKKSENDSPLIAELATTEAVLKRPALKIGAPVVGLITRLPFSSKNGKKRSTTTTVMIDPTTTVQCEHVDCLGLKCSNLSIGTHVKCVISSVVKGVPFGSLSNNGSSENDFFLGIVHQITPSKGISVSIPALARSTERKTKTHRFVNLWDISNNYDKTLKIMSELNVGDSVCVRHVRTLESADTPESQNDEFLSMRDLATEKNIKDALVEPNTIHKLEKGNQVRGFVRAANEKECIVNIGLNVTGHIDLIKLSDGLPGSPEKLFPTGKLVCGRTESVSVQENGSCRVSLSLVQKGHEKNKVSAPGKVSAPATEDAKTTNEDSFENGFFSATVRQIVPSRGIFVSDPSPASSKKQKHKPHKLVSICDVSDDYDKTVEYLSEVKVGDSVRVRYVNEKGSSSSGSPKEKGTLLSMRDEAADQSCKDIMIDSNTIGKLKKGSKVRGFVRATSRKGCFINIGRNVVGYVKLSNLSDATLESPEKEFPPGKLVSAHVEKLFVEKDGNCRVSMSLVRTGTKMNLIGGLKADDLKEGDVVNCAVKKILESAVLVKVSKGLTGLLHVSHIDKLVQTKEDFVVGQRLTCVVIHRDEKRIELGMKRAYFEASHLPADEIDDIMDKNDTSLAEAIQLVQHGDIKIDYDDLGLYQSNEIIRAKVEKDNNIVEELHDSEEDQDLTQDPMELDEIDEDEDMGVNDTCDSDDDSQSDGDVRGEDNAIEIDEVDESVTPLKVEKFDFGSFEQDDTVEGHNEADNDSPTEPKSANKRTSKDKREKKRLKEAIETETRLREEALAEDDNTAETAEDFERLLIGEPNSSMVWIRYMGHCVELAQLEKARSIAERALTTIAVDQEEERLNIWIAYVNLESKYGSMNSVDVDASDSLGLRRDAAIMRVFERGCHRVNDVKAFHLKVAKVLDTVNEKLCVMILRRATKKFKECHVVWTALGEHYFRLGELDQAQQCLERALMSLPKSLHTQIISKFAQLQYKHGSVERGRTVFESLIGNFPKRHDLWNIYLDMETGQCRKAAQGKGGGEGEGNAGEEGQGTPSEGLEQTVQRTRRTFERFASNDFSTKKMKFVFIKWINFEKAFGTDEHVKMVKNKAREYVDRMRE